MKGLQWSYRLVAWACRRVFPSVARYEAPALPFADLQREFRYWEILTLALTVFFGLVTGLIW